MSTEAGVAGGISVTKFLFTLSSIGLLVTLKEGELTCVASVRCSHLLEKISSILILRGDRGSAPLVVH